ncbi:MAG: hypothetical protein IKB73_07565, partial [Ruminococcus sp.]|nr:hypothetical protein [Ruminococcus sp.]
MLKLRRLLSLLLITAVIISSNTMLYAGALTPAQPETLPSSVDLSETPYFPELSGTEDHITHQDTIDTTVFSTIHYQFTYMMNRARGVETTFENTFSPLFGNNIMHEKIVKGDYKTNYEQIHTLLKNVGCATNTTIPFRKTYLNSYTDWPEKESMWREATKNRIVNSFDYKLIGGDDTQVTSPDDIDLYELKSAISNGEMPCITIDTGIGYGGHIKAHEAVPANEKYVGQFVKFEQVEHTYESRYHITETYALVGYDDNVWCDINGNDEIDSGEMGILKLAHSRNLGGFIYLAYDFFNKTSSVKNFVSQSEYSETRMAPVLALKGIEVEKERSEKEIYVRFDSNLYAPFEIYFTAEGNGEKYEKKFLEGVNYADTTHAYYGPATMIFPLSDLVPGLSNENFHDYTFTMTLKNTGQDSNHISANSISLVNEYEGTDSYVSKSPNLKVSASEVKSITLKSHTLIYYLGYENVTLHYRTANGDFEAVPMVKGEYKNVVGGTSQSEFFHDSYGYKYHYFLEDIEDTEIYFTDDEGHVDDNNGQYYKAKSGNNYFVTKGVKEPLTISEITLTNGTPDIGKYSHFDVKYSGGYEPYTIKCYATNLDTGERDLYNYPHDEFEPDYKFKKAGNYEISVHIKDFKGDVVSSAIKVKVVNNTFSMTTTADKTECFVAECINFESVTSFENFSLLAENITSSTKYVVRNSENKVMWEETIAADDIDVDGNTSTSR